MYLILPADEVTPPPPSAITSSNLAQPSFLLFIGLAWQHRCLRALTWVGGTCLEAACIRLGSTVKCVVVSSDSSASACHLHPPKRSFICLLERLNLWTLVLGLPNFYYCT